jgi:hypothetical protein
MWLYRSAGSLVKIPHLIPRGPDSLIAPSSKSQNTHSSLKLIMFKVFR